MMHSYAFYLFAFLFVLGLIGLFALGLNLIAQRGLLTNLLSRVGKMMPKRRMAVVEHLPLDPQHRLVLIRCDETEYLLMLGKDHSLQLAPSDGMKAALGDVQAMFPTNAPDLRASKILTKVPHA